MRVAGERDFGSARSWLGVTPLVTATTVMTVMALVVTAVTAWLNPRSAGAQLPPAQRVTFGYSVQGRTLEAVLLGQASARRTVVVVGSVHGDEPGGLAVTDVLTEIQLPSWLRLVVIPTLNPDGLAAGTRGNANGVDLNRNADFDWLPEGASEFTVGGYYPGPFPLSEPETVAVTNYLAALGTPRGAVVPPTVGIGLVRRRADHHGVVSGLCRRGRPAHGQRSSSRVAVGLVSGAGIRLGGGRAARRCRCSGTALGHAAAILQVYADPGRSRPRWVRNPVHALVNGPGVGVVVASGPSH